MWALGFIGFGVGSLAFRVCDLGFRVYRLCGLGLGI